MLVVGQIHAAGTRTEVVAAAEPVRTVASYFLRSGCSERVEPHVDTNSWPEPCYLASIDVTISVAGHGF
jgi:hypothetical protein